MTMERTFEKGIEFAKAMDLKDELREYRKEFFLQENEIYMDGNSLGMASKPAVESLEKMIERWKVEGVRAWNDLYRYSEKIADLMAPLICASAKEVTVTGSTTANIHQALATFYHPTAKKYKILIDDLNFPTDRYAVESIVQLKGYSAAEAVKVVPSTDGQFIDEEAMIEAMTEDVAVILLPAVLYRSAQLLDMKRLTEEAHKRGILIGFDLCHGIGAVEIDFSVIQPDFAVWCTYKYLNGGFGSTAGLYINQKHFQQTPGLAGWFGNRNDTQFQLKQQFEHQPDASGWQIGSPALFSMATIEGSLQVFKAVGMAKIREVSLAKTAYLMYLIDERLTAYGYSYTNKQEDSLRGGHVCVVHREAYRIAAVLRDHHVVPDFREPNVIRLAPIALYTSYEDIHKVVDTLEEIVREEIYLNYSNERSAVI